MRVVSCERDEIHLAFDRNELLRLVDALESAADRVYRSDLNVHQKRAAADKLWGWIDRLNGVVWDFDEGWDSENGEKDG